MREQNFAVGTKAYTVSLRTSRARARSLPLFIYAGHFAARRDAILFLWPPLGQRRPTLVLSACRYESPGILSSKLVLAFVVVHRTNRKDLRIQLHLPVFHYKFQEESSAKMKQDENERSPLFYSPLIRRSVLITFLNTFLLPCESLTLKVGAHPLLLLHFADYGFPHFQDFYKRIPFKSSHCSRRWVSTAWFLALRLGK